jgi:cytochrome c-type biogenesis protein CcmH/NrfG
VLGAGLAGEPLRIRIPARAAVAVAAAVAAIVQLPGIVSTDAVRSSQAAARAGRYELALSYAKRAVADEPWSATALEQQGLVLEATGHLGAAAAELRHAIADEPFNYEHWLILARIETERGRIGVATRDYERARKLAPHALVFAAGG